MEFPGIRLGDPAPSGETVRNEIGSCLISQFIPEMTGLYHHLDYSVLKGHVAGVVRWSCLRYAGLKLSLERKAKSIMNRKYNSATATATETS
jgi:hypothetical protein